VVAITGIVLGAAGIGVGIGVPLGIEGLKSPKLDINPVEWRARGPVYPMTFASVQVVNRPIRRPLRRDVAEACEVAIDFFTWGDEASRERVFDTIQGRWDSHVPEPYRLNIGFRAPDGTALKEVPMTTEGLTTSMFAIETRAQFDPSLVSLQQDLSVGSDRGRVSVAVLRDGEAFAFSDESYRYMENHFGKPDWQLIKGRTYRVRITVKGSNAEVQRDYKLEFYSDDFTKFRLEAVGK
jgi:hypothetical protein